MPPFFDDGDYPAEAYNEVVGSAPNDSWSYKLIVSAAAYEAGNGYVNHCEENGEPESHAKANEILAAYVGACVDRVIEVNGLDCIGSEKAKYHGRQLVEQKLSEYGSQDGNW
ncbi:uncharacterized protein FIESC28_01647 [Fusarium coffeatum]|uniref:Uncharacterized protein n=1 Tax=Fusarium coffeatum TaxID=231269 RepID=A0A366S8P1_9HYPO|nr:uncharacterized protein FIESC28_01647 [Fusarium coffeatum]RBR25684.1 hypothetical protein FIESC28_01647 [Fusarium coffeatum]